MNNIGSRIRQIRKANKLTQKEFAERIYVSSSYVCKLESEKEEPTAKLVKLIALEFNVSTEYLLGKTDNPEHFRGDFFGRKENGETPNNLLEEDTASVVNAAATIMNIGNLSVQSDLGGFIEDIADLICKSVEQGHETYTSILIHEFSDYLLRWCEHIRCLEDNTTEQNINAHFIQMISESQRSILEMKDMYIKRIQEKE